MHGIIHYFIMLYYNVSINTLYSGAFRRTNGNYYEHLIIQKRNKSVVQIN